MKHTTLRDHLLARADTPDIPQRLAAQRVLVLATLPPAHTGGPLPGFRTLYRELILRCRPVWAAVAMIWILTGLLNLTARLDDASAPRATPAQIAFLIAWARLRETPSKDGSFAPAAPPPLTGALHPNSPSAAC